VKRYFVLGLVIAAGSVLGGAVIGASTAGADDDHRPRHEVVRTIDPDASPKVTWL
jgi:hypothetical protein